MTTQLKKRHEWLAKAPMNANAPVLGKREISIMALFWSQSKVKISAAQILKQLNQDTNERITLTTVQSTIERLWRKKLLTRNKSGRAFIYQAIQDKNEVIGQLITEIGDEVSVDDPNAMVEGFVEYFRTKHPTLMDSLHDIIFASCHRMGQSMQNEVK